MRTTACMLIILTVVIPAAAQQPADAERDRLAATAFQLNKEGFLLFQQGKIAAAAAKLRQALDVRRQLYPESTFPDGHPELVESLNNVGVVLQAGGANAQAVPYFEQTLAMNRKLHPASKAPDGHADIARNLNNLGMLLEAMGQHDRALNYLEQALAMQQKLLPASKYPDGHPDLATGLGNVGYVLDSMGKYEQARPFTEQALAMNRKIYPASKYPNGHPDLAKSLNNLATLHSSLGAKDEALPLYQQTLAMFEKLHPPERFPLGHPMVAASLNNLGAVHRALGAFEQALPPFERALKMRQRLYPETNFPNGHPDLALSLDNIAALYESMERFEQAQEHAEAALAMRRLLYPQPKYGNGHPELAVSLARMQSLYTSMHAFAKALPFAEQALAMRRKLYTEAKYPGGHPDLANSLQSLGMLLQFLGAHDKAVPYCEQALAMNQRLYAASQGHRHVADGMNILGSLYARLGDHARAQPLLEQSLAMQRRLHPPEQFPNGHALIGAAINNLGALMDSIGDYEQAEKHYLEALAMTRRLYPQAKYPNGHKHIADGLSNLGFLMRVQGKLEGSLGYYKEALTMRRRLIDHDIATAPEAEALAILQALPLARDGFLTAAAQMPRADAEAAQIVWESKAAVTRMQEHRLAAARAAGDEHKTTLSRLREIRRQIESLLLDPHQRPADRDRQLAALVNERDRLERTWAAVMPPRPRDESRWEELSKSLPANTVCVDLLAYTRIERDPLRKGRAGETVTPSMVALIYAKDQQVKRVDLGPAAPIVRSVRAWRAAIDARAASEAPQQLRRLVWVPIEQQLPAATRTLYIAPDGELARVPWAALPGAKLDTILLEDFAGGIAVVPHATYLLEQLKNRGQPASGPESILAMGGVAYDPPDLPATETPYPSLPGTVAELKALRSQASGRPLVMLTGGDATWPRLRDELAKASYAHLATHGYFAQEQLSDERRRMKDQMRHWTLAADATTAWMTAARDPLAYTGLVLADANRPTSGQHGLVTGLGLVDLRLSNLKLVTLSACETGLGDLTEGEGVQGLQRAFHLAGCPNVVASLWKVNDAATAALMTKFYHEMWTNKRPPIEALREAQLTIYRRPDLIPDLAGERGPPNLKSAVVIRAGEPSGVSRRVADTRLWAAFVLSGVGR